MWEITTNLVQPMEKKKSTWEEEEGCNVPSLPTLSVCEKEKDLEKQAHYL